MITYPINSLRAVGVYRFTVVVNEYNHSIIDNVLSKINGIEYKLVVNKDVERENGYSLYLGAKHVEDALFYISMSDHIYPPTIPLSIARSIHLGKTLTVAVDPSPLYINVEEATKLYIIGDIIVDIGKHIPIYNYIDTGVFIASKKIQGYLELLVRTYRKIPLSRIVYKLSRRAEVSYIDIGIEPWIEIDTPQDILNLLRNKAVLLKTKDKD